MTTVRILSVIGTGDPFDILLTIPFKGGRDCMGPQWAEPFGIPVPEKHTTVGSRVWNVAKGDSNSAGSMVFCESCHQAFYPKRRTKKK